MRRFDASHPADWEAFRARLDRRKTEEAAAAAAACAIVQSVAASPDPFETVLEYTRRLDRWEATASTLEIPQEEWKFFARQVPRPVAEAVRLAAQRIRAFHQRQRDRLDTLGWLENESGSGIRLGQQVRPLNRVGIYIPGGRAAYPSTVLMNAIPARVAGVDEIVMVVPTPEGKVAPSVMLAAIEAGVDRVFRIGGAQAVAALAGGAGPVPRADKVVGPGNAYVQAAKKHLFGGIDIDMIAGPSEVLVIADETAHPAWVAADLLSQAEHDPLAAAVLISHDGALLDAVLREVGRQLPRLATEATARASLDGYGAAVLTASLARSLELADEIAPEHLELCIADPEAAAPRIRNAGAIFMGHHTPEPLGDYLAGPSHVLPTGGSARFFSPLGVYDFLKRTSLIAFGRTDLERLGPATVALAEAEGFPAHANAVRLRLESKGA